MSKNKDFALPKADAQLVAERGHQSFITPLFLSVEASAVMGKNIVTFNTDNYNKNAGASFLNAKDDAEAISAFLLEYRDSPLTLQAYAKEIERLLLWCIYKEFYDRLLAAGKAKKVVITACMRKLLIHLNSLMCDHYARQ
ncbi:MAG: hypothetical protein KAS93_02615 [Gammaproteobacteria bacterium]|nr:hypothetical protein [Gammaproteobacteria bacterium]